MLISESFKNGFIDYCDGKIAGALADQAEFQECGYEPQRIQMAGFWAEFYERTKKNFIEKYDRDYTQAFRKLQDEGYLDIITCAATHGYAPLLSRETSINAQFKIAVDSYKRIFGRAPTGTWLAECAYRPGYEWKAPVGDLPPYKRPGVETFLAAHGIKYFFVDTALLMGGVSQGVYAARFPLLKSLWDRFQDQYKPQPETFDRSPYKPYLVGSETAKAPVAFFTRDENTGILVWSGEHGYPGSSVYLDFHKRHYQDAHGGGSGLRYWKVTHPKADLGQKEIYDINAIAQVLDENAGHFKEAAKGVLGQHLAKAGAPGFLVAPYDAELFGHWWWEGPYFLNRCFRFFEDDPEIEMTHCREYLSDEANNPTQVVQLTEGSWGQGSSHYIWLNEQTLWTWEKVYEVEKIVEDLCTAHAGTEDPQVLRLMQQLCRENLVFQASDWQFLISTWSARDYAENRLGLHYENCKRLAKIIGKAVAGQHIEETEWKYVALLEQNDSLFQDIDISAWSVNSLPEF
jgi:1,4-alpha-glucan branching enzyme